MTTYMRVWNGSNEGAPIATLQRPDGTTIAVYQAGDLPGALAEAIGPPPVCAHAGYQVIVTGSMQILPATDYTPGWSTPVYALQCIDGGAEATEFAAQVEAYNMRAQALKEAVLAILPGLLEAMKGKR